MQASATRGVRRQPTYVFVQSGLRDRWEVTVTSRQRSQRFADRELALSYAQIWASVNRPSMVRVYGASGAIEHEWAFN